MKYLLDSNIIVDLTMNLDARVIARAGNCDEGDMVTSTIALAEVAFGSARGNPPPLDQLREFLEEVPVLPFDQEAAFAYSDLPFKRARFDRLIAAQALSLDLIVVTRNEQDFADVPGLRVENWAV